MTFRVLSKKQLYAKFSKCDFWMKEVLFLGHIISKNGVTVDPAKVVVMEWKQPKSVSKVRSFLGLVPVIIGDTYRICLQF